MLGFINTCFFGHTYNSVLYSIVVFGVFLMSPSAAISAPATITAPVECLKDNCLQYEMTTRDGFKLYLREWLKPNYGSPALSRQHSISTQAMLMMPGFPHAAMVVWERQVNDKYLSSHYRMVTLEIRGHGDSSKNLTPTDVTGQQHADDIQDAINLLGLSNPVLMSHSMSGTRVSQYLTAYGDGALGGIVATASFMKNDNNNPQWGAEIFTPEFFAIGFSFLGATNDFGDYYRANAVFGDLSFFKIDDKYKTTVLSTDMVVPVETRLAIFAGLLADNAILATVEVPAMVIHAKDNCADYNGKAPCKKSKDALINLGHAIENFNLLDTNSVDATLEIMDKVGHFPQAEDPKRYNAILRDFLESL